MLIHQIKKKKKNNRDKEKIKAVLPGQYEIQSIYI